METHTETSPARTYTRPPLDASAKIEARELTVHYGDAVGLNSVSLDIPERRDTALIGPSGCGKSTFLRCLNRMNDHIAGARVEGQVHIDGTPIYGPGVDPVELRRRV